MSKQLIVIIVIVVVLLGVAEWLTDLKYLGSIIFYGAIGTAIVFWLRHMKLKNEENEKEEEI